MWQRSVIASVASMLLASCFKRLKVLTGQASSSIGAPNLLISCITYSCPLHSSSSGRWTGVSCCWWGCEATGTTSITTDTSGSWNKGGSSWDSTTNSVWPWASYVHSYATPWVPASCSAGGTTTRTATSWSATNWIHTSGSCYHIEHNHSELMMGNMPALT